MTPSPEISRGVVWAKANMLRVVKEYPHGWGSTNSPPSDILVSRDTSWFVHGFDYFWPEFSRNAFEVFNRAVEPSGLMVEYVRGVSGYKTDYDLNINDDTPLHLIAMLHHYNATLDDEWVATQHRTRASSSPTTCSPSATIERTGLLHAPKASTCTASRRGATSFRITRSTAR